MSACCLCRIFAIALLAVPFLIPSDALAQAWKSQIGFTDLVAEKGDSLEDGSGLIVFQPEAPNTDGDYLPDATNAQFSGKSFTAGSGASGSIGHATSVGVNFYGNTNSMTPGITNITGYDANGYIGADGLQAGSGNDPGGASYQIGNHSYVGRASSTFTASDAEDILERFDFVVNRDNTVMVVGADNGSTTPRVLAPAYNAITVGRSNGSHSTTLTPNYGPARFATSIVVPDAGATSFSTPVVSSAAALLVDAGSGTNFVQNEVVRATLFAGATKDEFASWDRTATRPMDEVFGFGELNIQNSYHIFEGGEFDGTTSDPVSSIELLGWDYGDHDGTNDLLYDFTIDPGEFGTVSAVLSWNMNIIDNDASILFDPVRDLADLNLELLDSTGSIVDLSNGTDYNNEHIYFENLDSGDYTFRISAATGSSATDFGFAWNIVSAVPEPSSAVILGLIGIASLIPRRRIQ